MRPHNPIRDAIRRHVTLLVTLVLSLGALSLFTAQGATAASLGGPVILGGDDQTDHGGYDSISGTNTQGWVYIEKAIGNIKPQVSRAGADGSIVALGSADPGFDPELDYYADAGAAIASAAYKNDMPVSFYPSDAAIQDFFDQLAVGTANPSVIWISGTGAMNDLGSNGGATALQANSTAIADFVNSGGGLMSHGVDYTWAGGILPAATVGCGGGSALELTEAGQAAFPGLTNDHLNSGPWHGCFDGDIGDLGVLATSSSLDAAGNPARVIIGGSAVTLPGTIELTPAAATNPVGTSHTVTATVRNSDGTAKSGAAVSFEVTDGPATGTTGTGSTDSDGKATFTYANDGTAGTDTISASFTDSGTTYTATASKTWEAAQTVTTSATGEGVTTCPANRPAQNDVCRGVRFSFDLSRQADTIGQVALTRPRWSFEGSQVRSFSVQDSTAAFVIKGTWKGQEGYRVRASVVDGHPDRAEFTILDGKTVVRSFSGPVAEGDISVRG